MKSINVRAILAVLFAAIICNAAVFAQQVIITDAATFTGSGTFKIKGDIIDSAAAGSVKTITGITHLAGTADQNIGDSAKANARLVFEQLKTDSGTNKIMKVPVTVSKKLDLTSGALVVNGHTLTIDSATAKTGGSLSAATANDVVVYDGTGNFTQSIIDGNYKKISVTGSATKDLLNPVTVDTITHTSGGLKVTKALTVAQSGHLGIIADATATLNMNGAVVNTIDSVATTSSTGTIVNGSSVTLAIGGVNGHAGTITTSSSGVTVGNLAGSTGTISSTGNGALQFTNAAVNAGTIQSSTGAITFNAGATNSGTVKTTSTGNVSFAAAVTNTGTITDSGAAGSVTFSTTLANNAGGKVLGGPGGITFTGKPTNAGTISANAGTLTFSDSTVNSGTLALASQGHATFANGIRNTGTFSAKDTAVATINENFASAGTLSFADSSRVILQGNTTVVPSAKFANLNLSGPAKTAAGNDTLTGNVLLASNLEMSSNKFVISAAGSKVGGTGEIDGAVNRTHAFGIGTYYAFNKDSVGLAIDQAITPNITLTMRPDSAFASASPSQKYAKRYYGFNAPGIGTANLKTLALIYTNAERTAAVTDENKFGVRADYAGTWKKVNNAAGYTRSVDTTSNVVLLANVATPLSGVQELGIINTAFQTIVDNQSWASNSTWDEGSQPTSSDDAEVWNNGVTVSSVANAASVEILATKSLSVNSGSLTVAGLFNHNGSQLTVASGATLNLSNNFRINGPVSNDGTINVGQ